MLQWPGQALNYWVLDKALFFLHIYKAVLKEKTKGAHYSEIVKSSMPSIHSEWKNYDSLVVQEQEKVPGATRCSWNSPEISITQTKLILLLSISKYKISALSVVDFL